MSATRRKRWLRLLLWAAVALPLALFALLAGYLLFGDIDPPEDSDLLARPEVAPEENGWDLVDFAPGEVWSPDVPRYLTMDEVLDGKAPWDQALAEEIIAENAAAIERLDRALACKTFVAPAPGPLLGTALLPWRLLSRTLEFRSLSASGRETSAPPPTTR